MLKYMEFLKNHTPIQVEGPLAQFFSTTDNFGPLDIDKVVNGVEYSPSIISELPLARTGLMLKSACWDLILLYIGAHFLRSPETPSLIQSDAIFQKWFGEDFPACRLIFNENKYKRVVSMDTTISEGLIKNSLNTFDVIRISHPEFDHLVFPIHYIRSIVYINSLRNITGLDQITRDQLVKEYHLIRKVSKKRLAFLSSKYSEVQMLRLKSYNPHPTFTKHAK